MLGNNIPILQAALFLLFQMESSSSSGSYSGSSYIKIVDFPVDEVTFIDTGQGEETVTYHVQNCSASSKRLRAALKKGTSEV